MFEELNRRKMELDTSSPGTPQTKGLAEPVEGTNKEAADKTA
jgi:hypothetical protein